MTKISIFLFFFCGMDLLITTNGMYIYLMDEHISKNYTVVRKYSKKQSSYVRIIQATEHFPTFFPASFTHVTHETLVNSCKLFFGEGVLLLRPKQF